MENGCKYCDNHTKSSNIYEIIVETYNIYIYLLISYAQYYFSSYTERVIFFMIYRKVCYDNGKIKSYNWKTENVTGFDYYIITTQDEHIKYDRIMTDLSNDQSYNVIIDADNMDLIKYSEMLYEICGFKEKMKYLEEHNETYEWYKGIVASILFHSNSYGLVNNINKIGEKLSWYKICKSIINEYTPQTEKLMIIQKVLNNKLKKNHIYEEITSEIETTVKNPLNIFIDISIKHNTNNTKDILNIFETQYVESFCKVLLNGLSQLKSFRCVYVNEFIKKYIKYIPLLHFIYAPINNENVINIMYDDKYNIIRNLVIMSIKNISKLDSIIPFNNSIPPIIMNENTITVNHKEQNGVTDIYVKKQNEKTKTKFNIYTDLMNIYNTHNNNNGDVYGINIIFSLESILETDDLNIVNIPYTFIYYDITKTKNDDRIYLNNDNIIKKYTSLVEKYIDKLIESFVTIFDKLLFCHILILCILKQYGFINKIYDKKVNNILFQKISAIEDDINYQNAKILILINLYTKKEDEAIKFYNIYNVFKSTIETNNKFNQYYYNKKKTHNVKEMDGNIKLICNEFMNGQEIIWYVNDDTTDPLLSFFDDMIFEKYISSELSKFLNNYSYELSINNIKLVLYNYFKKMYPLYNVSYSDIPDTPEIITNGLEISITKMINNKYVYNVQKKFKLEFPEFKKILKCDLMIHSIDDEHYDKSYVYWQDINKNIYCESKNIFYKNMYIDMSKDKTYMVNNNRINYNCYLVNCDDILKKYRSGNIHDIMIKLLLFCSCNDITVWYDNSNEHYVYINKYNVKFTIKNNICTFENYEVHINTPYCSINKWTYRMGNMFILSNENKYYVLMFPTDSDKILPSFVKYNLWENENEKNVNDILIKKIYNVYYKNNIIQLDKAYLIPIHYSYNKILCDDVNVTLLYLFYNICSENLINVLNMIEYVDNMTISNVYKKNSPLTQIIGEINNNKINFPFFDNIMEITLRQCVSDKFININPKKLTTKYYYEQKNNSNDDDKTFLKKIYNEQYYYFLISYCEKKFENVLDFEKIMLLVKNEGKNIALHKSANMNNIDFIIEKCNEYTNVNGILDAIYNNILMCQIKYSNNLENYEKDNFVDLFEFIPEMPFLNDKFDVIDNTLYFYFTIYCLYSNIPYFYTVNLLYNYNLKMNLTKETISNNLNIYEKYENLYKNKKIRKLKFKLPNTISLNDQIAISKEPLDIDLLLGYKKESYDYYAYCVYENSCKSLLSEIEKNKLSINEDIVINKYNNIKKKFNERIINKNEELTQFEFLFGNYIRQDQEDLINRMVSNYEKNESKIYQLLMGLGKSSVITPSVVLKLCNGDQYNVIIIVTPDNLLQNCINNVLPICCNSNINTIISDATVNTYDYIKNVNNKKTVYITTDTLLKKRILTNVIQNSGNMEMKKTCMLFDEIDLIIDPIKSEYNMTNKDTLSVYKYSKVITKVIMSFIDNFENICKNKENIKYNTSPHFYIMNISEDILCELYTYFLDKICSDIFVSYFGNEWKKILFNTDNKNFNTIINIFLNKKIVNPSKNNHVVYAILHIIYKLYNSIIKTSIYKIHKKNFGLRKNEHFAVPYVADHIPSTASIFSDPFFTIYYTYLCYKIQGINEKHIMELFLYYLNNDDKYKELSELLGNIVITEKNIKKFICDNKKYTDDIKNKITHKYILYLCTKKLLINYKQINCSTYDILSSKYCKTRCCFTGTPFIPYIRDCDTENSIDNTIYVQNGDKYVDLNSASHNIILYGSSKNQTSYGIISKFKQTSLLKNVISEIINNNYSCLIDVESLLITYSLYDVLKKMIKTFANKNGKKYVVYIDENDKKKYVDHNMVHYNYIDGSLPLEDIFVYFDQKHTTGQDIKQHNNVKALVLCKKMSRYRDVAQGIYRLRKLDENQSIVFGMLFNDYEEETNEKLYNELLKNEVIYGYGQEQLAKLQNCRTLCRSIDSDYLTDAIINDIENEKNITVNIKNINTRDIIEKYTEYSNVSLKHKIHTRLKYNMLNEKTIYADYFNKLSLEESSIIDKNNPYIKEQEQNQEQNQEQEQEQEQEKEQEKEQENTNLIDFFANFKLSLCDIDINNYIEIPLNFYKIHTDIYISQRLHEHLYNKTLKTKPEVILINKNYICVTKKELLYIINKKNDCETLYDDKYEFTNDDKMKKIYGLTRILFNYPINIINVYDLITLLDENNAVSISRLINEIIYNSNDKISLIDEIILNIYKNIENSDNGNKIFPNLNLKNDHIVNSHIRIYDTVLKYYKLKSIKKINKNGNIENNIDVNLLNTDLSKHEEIFENLIERIKKHSKIINKINISIVNNYTLLIKINDNIKKVTLYKNDNMDVCKNKIIQNMCDYDYMLEEITGFVIKKNNKYYVTELLKNYLNIYDKNNDMVESFDVNYFLVNDLITMSEYSVKDCPTCCFYYNDIIFVIDLLTIMTLSKESALKIIKSSGFKWDIKILYQQTYDKSCEKLLKEEAIKKIKMIDVAKYNLTIDYIKSLIKNKNIYFYADTITIFSTEIGMRDIKSTSIKIQYRHKSQYSKICFHLFNYCIYNNDSIMISSSNKMIVMSEKSPNNINKNFYKYANKQIHMIRSHLLVILKSNGAIFLYNDTNNILKYIICNEKITEIITKRDIIIGITSSNNLYYYDVSDINYIIQFPINLKQLEHQIGGSYNKFLSKYLKYKQKYTKLKKIISQTK